jgi:DNA gyrase subunit A
VAIKTVTDKDDLMIITKNGTTIRMSVKDIRVMGRNTQGVRLINLDENDDIAAVTVVEHEDMEEDNTTNENNTTPPSSTDTQ